MATRKMESSKMGSWCTVVTGACGGIGRAVVARLVARGARVLAIGRDCDRLADAYWDQPDVDVFACDVSTPEGMEALAATVKKRFDGAEGFVHAAGFDAVAPISMVRADDMQRLFALHAAFPLRFLGWMSKRGNHAPQSSAVLVSSLAAHEGAKGHAAYAAAKGAVEGFLKPAAAELADKGLRLNAVVLGIVETDMSRSWLKKLAPPQLDALRASYPFGFGSPAAAAAAIDFLLSPGAAWITGQTLVCDGGHSL